MEGGGCMWGGGASWGGGALGVDGAGLWVWPETAFGVVERLTHGYLCTLNVEPNVMVASY